jgi:uncharacterized protein (TIGR03643 family)
MLRSESFTSEELFRIVQMAWEDRTPFEAIFIQFGLRETEVISLMRQEMQASSFKRWRRRVGGRATKHLKLRGFLVGRFKCKTQRYDGTIKGLK